MHLSTELLLSSPDQRNVLDPAGQQRGISCYTGRAVRLLQDHKATRPIESQSYKDQLEDFSHPSLSYRGTAVYFLVALEISIKALPFLQTREETEVIAICSNRKSCVSLVCCLWLKSLPLTLYGRRPWGVGSSSLGAQVWHSCTAVVGLQQWFGEEQDEVCAFYHKEDKHKLIIFLSNGWHSH